MFYTPNGLNSATTSLYHFHFSSFENPNFLCNSHFGLGREQCEAWSIIVSHYLDS